MNEETIHNLITFEDTLAQYISDENVQKCVAFSQNNIKYYNGKEKIDIEKRKENIGKIYFLWKIRFLQLKSLCHQKLLF